jgi:hypothetical protein
MPAHGCKADWLWGLKAPGKRGMLGWDWRSWRDRSAERPIPRVVTDPDRGLRAWED